MNETAILEIAQNPASRPPEATSNRLRSRASITLLHALSRVSALLGEASDFDTVVPECLRLVGEATGVDRAYVFEGQPNPTTGEVAMARRLEWCRPGFSLSATPVASTQSARRWDREPESERPESADVDDLAAEELALFEGQGLQAVLVVPIFVEGFLWGSIGFDDYTFGDPWGTDEIDVLMCLASGLGGLLRRLQATRALRKSEAFHRSIVENSREIVFTLDRFGRFQYVSPAWQDVQGSPPEAVIGKMFTEVIHPEDVAHCWERLRHRMQFPDDVGTIDYRVPHSNGSMRFNSTRASVVRNEEDHETYIVGVAVDVTERQQRENDLSRLAKELQTANTELSRARDTALSASDAKGRFLATMSHELRTPLNGVIGTTSLLLETGLSDDARELVRTIQSSGETLIRVINDILDFSKVEAGRMEIEHTPVDLSSLVSDVASLYEGHARSKGLRLSVEGPEGPVGVMADPVRLKQVLGNLVGNGLKFTLEGGVKIRWEVHTAGEAAVLELHVSDSGIGIAPERLGTLFQPFDQGDVSIHRRFGGTGLGLAISKHLVELMNGEISVRSGAAGTTFSLHIPMRTATLTVAAADIESTVDVSGLRVLLAEDNAVNVMVATRILSSLGCGVEVASDGMEAIAKAFAADYDLILMDMQMPNCDGLEASRAIRQHEAKLGGRRRIVALTANAMAANREACLDAGMDGFLAKPFTVAAMRNCIAEMRPDRRLAA
jgi:PAS domain S-box-containing protein